MKTRVRNAEYTKNYNRKLVLNLLINNPASRADLARLTGLSRASLSIIADELIAIFSTPRLNILLLLQMNLFQKELL